MGGEANPCCEAWRATDAWAGFYAKRKLPACAMPEPEAVPTCAHAACGCLDEVCLVLQPPKAGGCLQACHAAPALLSQHQPKVAGQAGGEGAHGVAAQAEAQGGEFDADKSGG